jgi:hypothetical protein
VIAAYAGLTLALGGAPPTAAKAAPAASSANRATFEDSRGEMANAPEITNVVVSNNDAGRITINGLPRLVEGMLVGIDIDSKLVGMRGMGTPRLTLWSVV